MDVETRSGKDREAGSFLIGEISGIIEIRRRSRAIIHLCFETIGRKSGRD